MENKKTGVTKVVVDNLMLLAVALPFFVAAPLSLIADSFILGVAFILIGMYAIVMRDQTIELQRG